MAFFAATALIVVWPDFLFTLLGKDVTLTGRTGIWSAVLDSIAKRPLLGYGYQAFWLGLEGESYRVILAVSWVLAQAQNGFLDVTLEMGIAGLTIVLLVFGFAFRDGVVCLLRSRDDTQPSGGGVVSRHRSPHSSSITLTRASSSTRSISAR